MDNPAVLALQNEIVDVFEQVTRYPRAIIAPDASLEEDLGIDSVKLGEIFSVLRERYRLPDKLDIARERLRTISGISQALHEYLAATSASPPPAPVAIPRESVAATITTSGATDGKPSLDEVRERVMAVFAEVTRYPREILTFDAHLEEDLGIDSVKLGEIFSVVREQHHLPEKIGVTPEELKTIGGLATALHRFLGGAKPVNGTHHGANGHHGAAAAVPAFATPSPTVKTLRGKVAFISGSGRGLGRDIALYLGELGATVVVNSFHSRARGEETAAEINAAGGEAWHLWGSMANPTQLHQIFDQIEERHGGLDFFVSNASNGMLAPIEELTVEHWEKAFRTNVVGLHQGAVRAARLMKRRGGGKIVTLSSPAAHGYVDYFGCMGAVKAAVESLTKALAIELAKYNIQVNCVSPGPIDGELLRKWPESDRLISEWTRATPLERLCEHRDVSHFVAYLLSEPVKVFTGSILVLDGGISSRGW